MDELEQKLDEYETRLCYVYPRSCTDCPANAHDLGYGNDFCGFNLVRDAIKYCKEQDNKQKSE